GGGSHICFPSLADAISAVPAPRAGDQLIRGPCGDGHDGQSGVGAALGGQHTAVGDVEVGHGGGAAPAVHVPVPRVLGHPRSTHQVGVTLDRYDLVGAGRRQDVLHDVLRGR